MSRLGGVLVIGISLMMPVSFVSAQDHPDHDKHHWSDQEQSHWQEWEKQHHKKNHDWEKASKREQHNYWKWRDQHPDAH